MPIRPSSKQEAGHLRDPFSKIKEIVGETKMTTIITDFEEAVFYTVEKVYAEKEHKGCRYHNNAAVWRKLGDLGLQTLFHQNEFQEPICKLYSLSYFPKEHVVTTYNEVTLPLVEKGLDNIEDWLHYSDELEEFGVN